MTSKKIIIKSLIVAIIAALTDFYVHTYRANPEVFGYYFFKIVLYYVVAYYVFEPSKLRSTLNVFKLKDKSIPFFVWFSILASVYHGLYYRIFDWYTGKGFLSFARVGDVDFLHFSENIFIEGILDWLSVHASGVLVGFLVAEFLDKKRIIK